MRLFKKKEEPKKVTKWRVTVYFRELRKAYGGGEHRDWANLTFDKWVRAEAVANRLLHARGAYNHDSLGEYNDVSVQGQEFPSHGVNPEECLYIPPETEIFYIAIRKIEVDE